MKRPILAASISLMLLLGSAPAGAWYQWYSHNLPAAPAPTGWAYQNYGPGADAGTWPEPVLPPWLWFMQQPNWATLWMTPWMMPAMTSGVFVEQSQNQFGYQIRVHTPDSHTSNLDISAQDGVIAINSRRSSQAGPGGPAQMQQSGWTTRWITLPTDANLGAIRMSRTGNVVEIFVPRFG